MKRIEEERRSRAGMSRRDCGELAVLLGTVEDPHEGLGIGVGQTLRLTLTPLLAEGTHKTAR